jgi:hypothetical protein
MKLEHKDITGKVYFIALISLKQFNGASAEIPDPVEAAADEFEEEDETEDETEDEPEAEDEPE